MSREKILSVSIKDCEVQTFKVGGNGGQKVNKASSGVRVIHHPSGARAESTESRSQFQNKRAAFLKMIELPSFKHWLHATANNLKTEFELQAEVDASLSSEFLKTEIKQGKDWVEVNPDSL